MATVPISGRYAVLRRLGSGSAGTVYLARDALRGREVALKVIHNERISSNAVAALQGEFQAIASLSHPRIAAALDFGYTEGGLPFYTREYVPGRPMNPGPPPDEEPSTYLKPVLDCLEALEYLHDHRILHLDVHAGNLIISQDPDRGSILIDFGLVASAGNLRHGPVTADLRAVPPELIRGGTASPLADVFLAGGLLHYRLTGRLGGEVRLPREVPGWGPRLTLDLERIASKALQPSPERRFRSIREFREALWRSLGEKRSPPAPTPPREVILGRERELGEIERRLRAVAGGGCEVMVVTGEAGWGKTRLLAEARIRAQLRGLEVVSAHGLDPGGSHPALIEALRRASKGERWLEHLAARHGSTPEGRARLAAGTYLLESGPPLVVLIDDLHAIDLESRLLAEALLSAAVDRRDRKAGGRGLGLFVTTEEASALPLDGGDVHRLSTLDDETASRLFRELVVPIELPTAFLADAIARAGGVPLRLRQIAALAREEWSRIRALPDRLDLLGTPYLPASKARSLGRRVPSPDRRVIEVLKIIGRPARLQELSVALNIPSREVGSCLRRLESSEVVQFLEKGHRHRLHPMVEEESGDPPSPRLARRVHAALARHLSGLRRPDATSLEDLARHRLALGRFRLGCQSALRASALLKKQGSFDRGLRLLEAALALRPPGSIRLRLAAEMSALAEACGDHNAGIRALEPLRAGTLPGRSTPVKRRLGIHYLRAGLPEKALEVLEEAGREAHPRRDREELVFIDSELAEIYTFRGQYAAAEAACRRGLERLQSTGRGRFREQMELNLRASLGHLEMRRMNLPRAREEFTAALRASRRHGTAADRAAVLNNLGITANQENDFSRALRWFQEARGLFLAAGERQETIRVACNLAIIHAKLGEFEQARKEIEKAGQLCHYYPGKQLQFFLNYARGTVAYLSGDAVTAIEAFEESLPVGRELGDEHLARYGEIYLAEARMASGEYREASRILVALAGRLEAGSEPLLARMVHSRASLLEALLGRTRAAARSRKLVEQTPRTGVEVLEAWNDLYLGMGLVLAGEGAGDHLESSRSAFERLGIRPAARLARLAILSSSLRSGDKQGVREALRGLGPAESGEHRFLAVAEPLLRAEAHVFQGEDHAAMPYLEQASGAIVGSPFLELDWRIELLRARESLQSGEVAEARRRLHRSLHTRDLLLQHLPGGVRKIFPSLPRFSTLLETERRLRQSPPPAPGTPDLRRRASFGGMVGASPPMARLYQVVEKIAAQEMAVLITGETGTGKELLARAIHGRSLRARGPFMAVHCASLLGEIFESELFGAMAGAYTGAVEDRPGLLETLAGGTLLLDEVRQLSPEAQAKLLQVIDSGAFRRLGSAEPRVADVRFLASTSADLKAAVAAGSFRADLYYRLCAVEVRLPPLRERREDIGPLALHLLERHAQRLGRQAPSLTTECRIFLERQPWPGNVRQLEGVLLRALLTASPRGSLGANDLEPLLAAEENVLFDEAIVERHSLPELKLALERQYLRQVFLKCQGDPRRMMERLGLKRTRFYTWCRKLGLDLKDMRKRTPGR